MKSHDKALAFLMIRIHDALHIFHIRRQCLSRREPLGDLGRPVVVELNLFSAALRERRELGDHLEQVRQIGIPAPLDRLKTRAPIKEDLQDLLLA